VGEVGDFRVEAEEDKEEEEVLVGRVVMGLERRLEPEESGIEEEELEEVVDEGNRVRFKKGLEEEVEEEDIEDMEEVELKRRFALGLMLLPKGLGLLVVEVEKEVEEEEIEE
jgi:hypothetical protein